ncbi:hypothetical protein PS918_02407 [Pseudomonas fluorescens]|uniref:Uncharacterized protein n=1 Tax=Pseudomonas fluorescens TaxID=294 RepID=A0A5E7S903_PSEFL|nr:hypothetical protein PS918_02407 [Pseudomonas fluorescens]
MHKGKVEESKWFNNASEGWEQLVRLFNAHIVRRVIRRAELHALTGEGHLFVVTRARHTAVAIREYLRHQHVDYDPDTPGTSMFILRQAASEKL